MKFKQGAEQSAERFFPSTVRCVGGRRRPQYDIRTSTLSASASVLSTLALPAQLSRAHMIRAILKMGDARLLEIAQPVRDFDTPELHALVDDMNDTMRQAGGVGLAAPQIGVGLQVMVFGFERSERYPDAPPVPHTVLINPTIEPLSDVIEDGWEGCLSIPGLRGVVPRHAEIRYVGFDPYGERIERIAQGFHARVVQHEHDHLIGRLYPSRITDFSRFGFTEVLFPELGAG